MAASKRPLPQPTPETQHVWDGTRRGELLLQRCNECDHTYFPPRPFCPKCSTRDVAVVAATGEATLASYVINERPHPAFESPYAIALVELVEGVRMMTNIVDCEQTPEALQLDMPLTVVFEAVSEEITLPLFRPVGAQRVGGAR